MFLELAHEERDSSRKNRAMESRSSSLRSLRLTTKPDEALVAR
jgi:hypothetical protein